MRETLESVLQETTQRLWHNQKDDGHWVFPLEADVSISAEYIILDHYLGRVQPELEARIGVCIRRLQSRDDGGWPLFHDGKMDISSSVKAYFALKLLGDDIEAPHMQKARKAILARGGLARCNVFTRIFLALFGLLPWRAVPVMPVELTLLPSWMPFHLSKVSYWSRTVIMPLLVVMAFKPCGKNPRKVHLDELRSPDHDSACSVSNHRGSWQGAFFLAADKTLRVLEPLIPKMLRRYAIKRAMTWCEQRRNGRHGLGAIFPAMVYYVMALKAYEDKPSKVFREALTAIDDLVIDRGKESYCQPCVSPIWDSGLSLLSLLESTPATDKRMHEAMTWLRQREVLEQRGDWTHRRKDLGVGGWAFQYENDYYPDVDDTAVVGMALDRSAREEFEPCIKRAERWIIGMQSRNGGWGAFDADNMHRYLDHIPFADHGALRDPPTVDVSARCLGFLAQRGYTKDDEVIKRGLAYIKGEQEKDGSWFGRWGTNYIYGTWSTLAALQAVGEDMTSPYVRKAVQWLKARQRSDGGWGEDGASYWHEHRSDEAKASTPSQTAWAVMALMAAGETKSHNVKKGIQWLIDAPREKNGFWQENHYTAVGFPRVFYLRYHGYCAYFPIWALARYQRLTKSNRGLVGYGI